MRLRDDALNPMNLEHIGLNVPNPVAVANWYTMHLGMKVMRKGGAPNYAHFLADARGKMMIEVYNNAQAPMPDYRAMHSLVFHIAFFVNDLRTTRELLLGHGASTEGQISTNDQGDELAMLRDPWGMPIQLVKRGTPMIQPES